MSIFNLIKKILPIVTIVVLIFFLVSLLGYTDGFGGLIPGFSSLGLSNTGFNSAPIFKGSMVLGLGVVGGILLIMTFVSFSMFQ